MTLEVEHRWLEVAGLMSLALDKLCWLEVDSARAQRRVRVS